MFKRFIFTRTEDVSGVSGVGTVAQGCVFDNGKAIVAWCVPDMPNSLVIYDHIDEVLRVHGHGGRTTIEWIN